MLAWAARELPVRRALLACHVDNTASRRVAARSGFTELGRDGDELRFARRI
jgi:RimJ/RimL family protein N-acetyltransferase